MALMEPGERMLVPCEEREGMYVLVDEGPPEHWRYLFVPDAR
jgi:hypothetical protein